MYKLVEFDECKKSPYVDINPNGRLPAIEDPNTSVVLWEVRVAFVLIVRYTQYLTHFFQSGAIVNYLIEEYDKAGRLTYTTSPEKYHVQQWLFFHASGEYSSITSTSVGSTSKFFTRPRSILWASNLVLGSAPREDPVRR